MEKPLEASLKGGIMQILLSKIKVDMSKFGWADKVKGNKQIDAIKEYGKYVNDERRLIYGKESSSYKRNNRKQ